MMSLEEAKAFLLKANGDGTNLYDHLSDLLLKLLIEKPENAYDNFEHYSAILRQQRLTSVPGEQHETNETQRAKLEQETFGTNYIKLLNRISNDEERNHNSKVANLAEQASLLEWAGICFSRSETFRIAISLQDIAAVEQVDEIRFWGKILALGTNFYVAEGKLSASANSEENAMDEDPGGPNKFTYWVMADDGTYLWVRLPSVTCSQILAARKLKRYVRNDLEGKVHGHPPFPGLEKHFIRAQIARITSSTLAGPVGFFALNEESDEIETINNPETQVTVELESWVHTRRELNATYARASPMPKRQDDTGNDVPWDNEHIVPALRSLDKDHPESWRLHQVAKTSRSDADNIFVLKSLIWPGAATVVAGNKTSNAYVGHALKFSKDMYQIQLPGPLQSGYTFHSENSDLGNDGLEEQKDVLEDPAPVLEADET